MPTPTNIFTQHSERERQYWAMWKDSGTLWQWQSAPRFYNPGAGGRQNDPLNRPGLKFGSADPALTNAIQAVRDKELRTRRQVLWNAQSNSGGPVLIAPVEDRQWSRAKWIQDFKANANINKYLMYGLIGFMLYSYVL